MSHETERDRRSSSSSSMLSVWPRSPKRKRSCDEMAPKLRPDSRHIVLDRDRSAKNGTIFSIGHGRDVNILFVKAGDYVDIRTCPDKNCDLAFAENEFGMKAHISPSILAAEEVKFYCVFCTSSHLCFDTEAALNKHIVDAHFYAKFEKGLKKKPPFNCPFSFCRFTGRNVQDLVYHYAGPDHHVFQKILTKAKYDLILKQQQGDFAPVPVVENGWNFQKVPTLKLDPIPDSKSSPLCKEIEAKAFNQLYVDEKNRADQLEVNVKRLSTEIEGLKKEWQEARSTKRAKESELKELKLKYDVLKSKYDNEVYGKKCPKKAKDEKESMKQDNDKLGSKIVSLEQEKASLEDQIKAVVARDSDLRTNLEKVEKRSKSRLVRIRRLIKVNRDNEKKLEDLRTELEFTERQFSALEKKKSELESLNSAIEVELKKEHDLSRATFEKLTTEKEEMAERVRVAENFSVELEQKIRELEDAKEEVEAKLRALEEKSASDVGDKSLPECSHFVNLLQEASLCHDQSSPQLQQMKEENATLRRLLDKYMWTLKMRDEEIRGLRRFDDDDIKRLNNNLVKDETKSENFN